MSAKIRLPISSSWTRDVIAASAGLSIPVHVLVSSWGTPVPWNVSLFASGTAIFAIGCAFGHHIDVGSIFRIGLSEYIESDARGGKKLAEKKCSD